MVLHKILKILTLVIGAIALVMGIWLFSTDNVSLIQPMMLMAYAVFAIVLLIVIVYVLKDLFTGNIKNTLISLGGFAVIILISYFASNGVETEMNNGEMLSENGSHWVGAGLVAFYILAGIAIAAMVFSGIKKLIK